MTKSKSNQEFKTGETVRLVSGGPIMIVKSNVYDNEVRCQWFAGKKLESGDFPPDSLVRVNEDEREK